MELGHQIVLFVSGGPTGAFTLPNLVGLSQDDAVARLALLGRNWNLTGQNVSDPGQHLRVLEMSPEPGTPLAGLVGAIDLVVGCFEGNCSPDAVTSP